MKTKRNLTVLVGIVALVVMAFLGWHKGTPSAGRPVAAAVQSDAPRVAAVASLRPVFEGEAKAGAHVEGLFAGFIDESVVEALTLTDREKSQLNRLFAGTRQEVLKQFAALAKVERLDPKSVQIAISVPKVMAEEWRAKFYADLEGVLGSRRFAEFSRLQNLARFEAGFEFFGVFPTVYEFDGRGVTLADSDTINFRATTGRTDANGYYQAYSSGLNPRAEFKGKFGALAELALGTGGP